MRYIQVCRLIMLLACLAGSSGSANASQTKRVALVVGNSAHVHVGELTNPVNDVEDVADILKRKNFSVHQRVDLDKAALSAAMEEFAQAAQGAEMALFFFAGHGIQVAGRLSCAD